MQYEVKQRESRVGSKFKVQSFKKFEVSKFKEV